MYTRGGNKTRNAWCIAVNYVFVLAPKREMRLPARGRNQQTLLLFPLGRLDKHTRSPFQPMQKYSLSLIQNTRRIFLAAPHSPSTLVYFAASVGKINSAWCNKNNGSAGLQFMSDFIMPNLRATIDTLHTLLCQNAAFNKNRKHAFFANPPVKIQPMEKQNSFQF
jgi:hypothetical protein